MSDRDSSKEELEALLQGGACLFPPEVTAGFQGVLLSPSVP